MKPFIEYVLDLYEDVPVNVVGSGNVAGTGVGPQGEPPGLPAVLKKLKMVKRKSPVMTKNEAS